MKKVFLGLITILIFISCNKENELGIKVRKLKKNETYVTEYKDHLYSIYISSGDEKELIYSNDRIIPKIDDKGKKILLAKPKDEPIKSWILVNDSLMERTYKASLSDYYLLDGNIGNSFYLGIYGNFEIDKNFKYLLLNNQEYNEFSVIDLEEKFKKYNFRWDLKDSKIFIDTCSFIKIYKSTDYDFKVLLVNEYQTVAVATLNCENKEFITEIDDSDKTAAYWPMTKMPEDCKPLYPEWMW